MATYKPIDASKEDFRKYLEKTGVLDAMTKVLIKCNVSRPENAIEFLIANLGDPTHETEQVRNLRAELQSARAEVERLKNEMSKAEARTGGDEQSASDGVFAEDANAACQNKGAVVQASGEGSEFPAADDAETAVVTAATAALTIADHSKGKENESRAVDAPNGEVQNGTNVENRDGKEREGDVKN